MDDFYQDYEKSDGIERALYAVAIALSEISTQIKYLGNGDAATTMGAIEGLSVSLKDGLSSISDQIENAAAKWSDIAAACWNGSDQ